MQRKVYGFDENDMKTYLCRRGLKSDFIFTEHLDQVLIAIILFLMKKPSLRVKRQLHILFRN